MKVDVDHEIDLHDSQETHFSHSNAFPGCGMAAAGQRPPSSYHECKRSQRSRSCKVHVVGNSMCEDNTPDTITLEQRTNLISNPAEAQKAGQPLTQLDLFRGVDP